MRDITNYLRKLGLSELEAKLYQGLLEKGSTTVKGLAEHVGIKRITAHFNIEGLIQKGLISETRDGARRKIVAERPENLEVLVEQRVEEAKEIRKTFPEMIKAIDELGSNMKEGQDMMIKYFRGKRSVKNVYEDIFKAKKIDSFVTSKMENLFPENIDIFTNVLNSEDNVVQIREILDVSPNHKEYVSRIHSKKYRYKFIKKKLDIADFIIYDGKVSTINEDEFKKPFAITITNQNYYNFFVELFNFIWDILPDTDLSSLK